MKTYIRKTINGYYIEFPQEIDNVYWSGKIGSTYEDFLDDKWILLSEEQVAFHVNNPSATIEQVLNMDISDSNIRTIDDAKREMINNVENYDKGPSVNSFVINTDDDRIVAWITPDKRTSYKDSIDAAEFMGIDTVTAIFEGKQISIPTQTAKTALIKIQLYADQCFIVTEMHKAAIMALDNIQDVDNYDYTVGYPERLTFVL